jgi:hypothetical protein
VGLSLGVEQSFPAMACGGFGEYVRILCKVSAISLAILAGLTFLCPEMFLCTEVLNYCIATAGYGSGMTVCLTD